MLGSTGLVTILVISTRASSIPIGENQGFYEFGCESIARKKGREA